MSKCDIEIQFSKPDRTWRGGDIVSGEAIVRVNKDITANGIVLTHYWSTHGRGNTHSEVMETIQLTGPQPLQAGEELKLPFEFESVQWPLTYRGHYIYLDHYVKVAVDVSWAIDPKHSEEFILLPGETPSQFGSDRSEVVDIDAGSGGNNNPTSLLGKALIGVIVIVLFSVLLMFAVFLLPIAIVAGGAYWLRNKAVARRVGDVEIAAPHAIVCPNETWPCKLAFTPRKTFRINGITAKLQAVEAATSGSGTNSTTHRNTVYEQEHVILPEGQLIAGQPFAEELNFELPETEAWSLDVSDNKITWTMDVRIDIPRFPDWSEKKTLQMVPAQFLTEATAVQTTPAVDSNERSATAPTEVDAAPAVADISSTAATVFELVSAINNADRYGNERSQIASMSADQTYNVSVIVDRVSTTIGLGSDIGKAHRQGRTVIGTIAGTEQEVQLFTLESNNTAVDAIGRSEVWECQATVQKWDSLYNRLVMLESQ